MNRADIERVRSNAGLARACPRCSSLRVAFRMQPRWIPVWPKYLFKGYRLGWCCEFCNHLWFE